VTSSPPTDAAIAELDELAARATAPATVEALEGWLLRADPALPFRRSNSVIPKASHDTDVGRRIERAESFYRDRGLPPRFQLGGSPRPADLDRLLAERGYLIEAPVDVLVGPLGPVASSAADPELPSGVRLVVATAVDGRPPSFDPAWLDAWPDADPAAASVRGRLRGYRRLLETIEPSTLVATADVAGLPAAFGLGVVDRGWLGVFGMVTRPDVRRKGLARAVLAALAQEAAARHAARLYLQVEQDNLAARALYGSVGLTRSHGYHYRLAPPT
jgi:GNAT superfamily N-acetyltransferase